MNLPIGFSFAFLVVVFVFAMAQDNSCVLISSAGNWYGASIAGSDRPFTLGPDREPVSSVVVTGNGLSQGYVAPRGSFLGRSGLRRQAKPWARDGARAYQQEVDW